MKQRFITGLIIVLPLAITAWIISLLVRLCTKPFEGIATTIISQIEALHSGWWLFSHEQILRWTTTLCILAAILVLLFVIGFVSRWLFFHLILKALDQLMLTMPLVNKVYRACREFTEVLFSSKRTSFSQVVWAPFPTTAQGAIGLVTNEVQLPLPSGEVHTFTSVLIPGTPNPTVGFLLLCPKSTLTPTAIGVDAAMKWVISCGSSSTEVVMPSTHDLPHATNS